MPVRKEMPAGQPLSFVNCVQTKALGCFVEALDRQVIMIVTKPIRLSATG
jgi:hypothetical protein